MAVRGREYGVVWLYKVCDYDRDEMWSWNLKVCDCDRDEMWDWNCMGMCGCERERM